MLDDGPSVGLLNSTLRVHSDTAPGARAVPGSQQTGTSADVKTPPDRRCFRARCEPGTARAPLSASSLMVAVFECTPTLLRA